MEKVLWSTIKPEDQISDNIPLSQAYTRKRPFCLVAQSMSDSWPPQGLTVARQAPLSMEFPRQEYRSGLPFVSPGHLPDTKVETVA